MALPRSVRAYVGLLILCACGGTEPEPVVTTVTIQPATATVEMGSTVSLAAEVHDQRGNALAGRPIA